MSKENDWEVEIDPELSQNPNYIAYRNIEDMLKEYYVGQWVAFAGGEMVLCEPDRDSLFKKLNKKHPRESVFIKEIVKEESLSYEKSPLS